MPLPGPRRRLDTTAIPGWFSPTDQRLFEHVLGRQDEEPPGVLVELGAYLGKSAVVVGQHLRDGEELRRRRPVRRPRARAGQRARERGPVRDPHAPRLRGPLPEPARPAAHGGAGADDAGPRPRRPRHRALRPRRRLPPVGARARRRRRRPHAAAPRRRRRLRRLPQRPHAGRLRGRLGGGPERRAAAVLPQPGQAVRGRRRRPGRRTARPCWPGSPTADGLEHEVQRLAGSSVVRVWPRKAPPKPARAPHDPVAASAPRSTRCSPA